MEKRANIFRYITILILVCLPVTSSFAQEIRTTAPNDLLQNESFEVEYEIISSSPIQEMPILVDHKDYEVLGDPQIRRSQPSPSFGDKYYTLKLIFGFKPKKAGTLKLPRIELVHDGIKQSSKKGEITVRALPKREGIDCFVTLHSTRNIVNVGDTLTLSYKLYSTKEISKIISIHTPRLSDIYYQDITSRKIAFEKEKVNGKEYYVYVFRQFLLQPKSLGTKELPSGEINIEYTYPTGRVRSDYWGKKYEEQLKETKKCNIDAISIRVHDMMTI